MALRLVQVNFKAGDDAALGQFWAAALGWGISSEGPGVTNVEPLGFAWPDPSAVCIDVVTVPDPETVRYRTHLELATTSTAHQADLVTRLEPRTIYQDTGPVAAVVVRCADPRAMARFWGTAIDWTVHEVTDDRARLRSATGVGPYLELVRASDATGARSRVHLDLMPYAGDDQAAEAAHLRSLGATDADVGQGDASWVCLADPEGNEFCVLTAG